MSILSGRFFILPLFVCISLTSAALAQNLKKPDKKSNKPISATAPQPAPTPEIKIQTQKVSLSDLEAAIVEEINQARNDPQKIVAYLEEYRKYIKDKMLSLPNKNKLMTIEGTAAVDDAINDLKKMSKGNSFIVSNGLSKVARQQVSDLQENTSLKHFGKDGSGLEARMFKVGFPGNAYSENISYRVDTAREVLLNMVIDDGYKSRSHRKNVFSPTFKLLGIACGVASDKTTVCVAEFADTFKER